MIVSRSNTEKRNERKPCPFEGCIYFQTTAKFNLHLLDGSSLFSKDCVCVLEKFIAIIKTNKCESIKW